MSYKEIIVKNINLSIEEFDKLNAQEQMEKILNFKGDIYET
jgi:hypothetical protein